MGLTNKIAWETLRSIDAAAINAVTYTPLGGPLLFPSYILKMVNNGSTLVTVSIDGVTDIDVAPSTSFWLYDEGKVGVSASAPAIPAGTQVYVKGTPGTTGSSIYLVSQYIVQA